MTIDLSDKLFNFREHKPLPLTNPQSKVFVSYTHTDDSEPDRWVSNFYIDLKNRLSEVTYGKTIELWFDNNDRDKNDLNEELRESIEKSELLVSVFSPPYITRPWCKKEMEWFIQNNPDDTINKMFIVEKIGVDQGHPEFPEFVEEHHYIYKFYKTDSGVDLEFRRGEEEYRKRLNILANKLSSRISNDATLTKEEKGYLYISESVELLNEREDLLGEFISDKYLIRPCGQISILDKASIERQIREDVKEAKVLVSLIGSNYGIVPRGGGEKSMEEMQFEILSEYSHRANIPYLIWHPTPVDKNDEKQSSFVKKIRSFKSGNDTSDFLIGSIEDFKGIIKRQLADDLHSKELEAISFSLIKLYLMIYSANEKKAVAPIKKELFDYKGINFEVTRTYFNGVPQEEKDEEEIQIKESMTILIYYDRDDERWLRNQIRTIQGIKADMNDENYEICIYCTGGHTYNTKQHVVINGNEKFDIKSLDPFFVKIKSSFNLS